MPLQNIPCRTWTPVFWTSHFYLRMLLTNVFPIFAMEGCVCGAHFHCVTPPSLFDGFQHDMMPPLGPTALSCAEPIRDPFVRKAMLVRAIGAEGGEVAFWRTHNGHVLVNLAGLS